MNRYGILNSRKRAIIALIHTVVFFTVAAYQLAILQHPTALISAHGKIAAPLALAVIYSIVTVVLLILLGYSRCFIERLYFGFCATSAAIGLMRSLAGDPTAYAELTARVMLLGCAVVTGAIILKNHSEAEAQFAD